MPTRPPSACCLSVRLPPLVDFASLINRRGFVFERAQSTSTRWWLYVCAEDSKDRRVEGKREGERSKWDSHHRLNQEPKHCRLQGLFHWQTFGNSLVRKQFSQWLVHAIPRSLCSIVMDYASGGDLFQRIRENKRRGCFMREQDIWYTFIQVTFNDMLSERTLYSLSR